MHLAIWTSARMTNDTAKCIVIFWCLYAFIAPALELFARAILCNWLVCLAIWTSARMTNDTAKCIVIFWCLYAFIASGFEHSIANMTLFAIALLAPHPASVTLAGMGWNLLWVSLGNIRSEERRVGQE